MSISKTFGTKLAALFALVVIGVFSAPDARADSKDWGISIYGGDPYYGGYALTYRDYDDDYYYRPYYRSRYYAPVRYYARPVYRPYYRAYYYDSPRRYYRHHRYYDRYPRRHYYRW